jgi:hypothetical protein
MIRLRCAAAFVLTLAVVAPFWADDRTEDGFVPMFNGKDLSGWVNVNCAPSTFFTKASEVITTGHPTGYLRTEKQYENFIAEFDWMHINKTEVGNSGFFVWADPLPAVGTGYTRGIEVQVLVNLEKKDYYTSQGDLFSIWGATCKPDRSHPQGWMRCLPSENRCKGGGEWNHYKVVANNGTLKLHVNGKEVSGLSECKPRKGYLGLESEGAECHFRNLVLKELPSTNPKPDEVADVAQGHKNLYTGLNLAGWKADAETKIHWQPRDWMLHADGKAELSTEKEFGDGELITDFQFPKEDAKPCMFVLRQGDQGNVLFLLEPGGRFELNCQVERDGGSASSGTGGRFQKLNGVGEWNRLRATLQQGKVEVSINGVSVASAAGSGPNKGVYALRPTGSMNFGNLFVLDKGK